MREEFDFVNVCAEYADESMPPRIADNKRPRKPRVNGDVTEDNIQRWAADKKSGRLGELSRMLLDERESARKSDLAYTNQCELWMEERQHALWLTREANGFRRWWLLWPLIRRLRR